MDLSVFKAYDIRGRVDIGQINPGLYEAVGRALVAVKEPSTVAIGWDCRDSSEDLADALASGITSAGSDVVFLGEVPTDAVYFYSGAHDVSGAVVTASHNPAEYNGLKLCGPGASPIGEESGLAEIKDLVGSGLEATKGHAGSVTSIDVIDSYVEHLCSIVDPSTITSLRVAVDAGNGMAGVTLEKVFARTAAELDGIYLEPDGTFPNHPADPLVEENLEDLQRLMSESHHDLGVAFDGDADRAFFLDDQGRPMSGSAITALVASALLRGSPGESVVHNLIVSKAVPEIVTELGGRPVRTRVGHSFIKAIMAETNAIFGGEHSGHYYFRDNFRADSGMLAMLFLLSILSSDGRPLSELRTSVERYHASGEINFRVADPAATMRVVEVAFPESAIDRLDGLTVDLGKEWFNLRPSNTEPLLRLNAEAPDEKTLADLIDRVTDLVEGTH